VDTVLVVRTEGRAPRALAPYSEIDMIGRVIANRYRLTAQLGAGGMGSVWRAEHLTLGSPVAVKLIDELIARDPGVRARFEREAQAAAALRSPHVVQILDYGIDDETPFIAMELLDGESLEERLTRVGRLSVEETLRVLTHVARAIGKAHDAGVIHRDLKPGNIFLVRNDDEEVAKVLDFGIAKTERTSATATRTGAMIGTPAYMSPEQAQGTKQVDGRTDLWAMGAIAFECLSGRLVFEGEALGELVLQICTKPLPVPSTLAPVPPEFDAWFARALDRAPEARFQTAKELADALREAFGAPRSRLSALPASHPSSGPVSAPLAARQPEFAATVDSAPSLTLPSESSATPASVPVQTTVGSVTLAAADVPLRPSPVRGLAVIGAVLVVGALAFFLTRSPDPSPTTAATAIPSSSAAATARDVASPTPAPDASIPLPPPASAESTPSASATASSAPAIPTMVGGRPVGAASPAAPATPTSAPTEPRARRAPIGDPRTGF
jgi:serine/threonine-protein kinase